MMEDVKRQTGQSVIAAAALATAPPGAIRSSRQSLTENKELQAHIERHARKCTVCRHPDRDDIEKEYRDWFKAADIARRYEIDDSTLNRHLKAVGLVSKRRENLAGVLDRILERGAEKPISGNDVIRAVKALACLSNDIPWAEPERRVIHIRVGDQWPAPLVSLAHDMSG